MTHTEDQTLPDTIGALAKEMRATAKRQEQQNVLILNEVRRQGKAIAELAKLVADGAATGLMVPDTDAEHESGSNGGADG